MKGGYKMDLEFTRGDTQFIRFQLKDGMGNPIKLSTEDKLYYTVKKNQNSSKILIQKKYPDSKSDLFAIFIDHCINTAYFLADATEFTFAHFLFA